MSGETSRPVVVGRTYISEKTPGYQALKCPSEHQMSCNHVELQADGEQFVGDRDGSQFLQSVALNAVLVVLGLATHRSSRQVRPPRKACESK